MQGSGFNKLCNRYYGNDLFVKILCCRIFHPIYSRISNFLFW